MSDTIYALATPPGKGGVAIIRVSGPASRVSLMAMTSGNAPAPRIASFRKIVNPVSRETVDSGLVIFFKGPQSYTGEDVVEYHIHGGTAVARALLEILASQKNHRLAEPGEFTKRAFENGKFDLTESEAVNDLISAETDLQRRQALHQLEGSLSHVYERWGGELKKALAHLEADLEFPNEDLPEGVAPQVMPVLHAVMDEVGEHLNDNRRGERLRDGIQIAVIGAPNAGKSSLVNALAQRDVAIVSEHAGTTRDVIEVHLDLGGYPVILADTAGLRPEQLGAGGQDAIESEGIRRALAKAERADIRLLLFDGAALPALDKHTLGLRNETALVVMNKADKIADKPVGESVIVSARTGQGLDELIRVLTDRIESLIGYREAPSLTRHRHREALEDCRAALQRSFSAKLPELMAEDVRLAVRHLGRITGRVDVEDLLDVIFRDFCIGK